MTPQPAAPPRPRPARRAGRALGRFWRSATLRFLLLTIVIALLLPYLGAVVAWRPPAWQLQLGDLSGWAQSAGSFAAVAVALVQSHQLQVARAEELRRQDLRERTQVHGWIAYQEDRDGGAWQVFLHNQTSAPIGLWVLRLHEAGSPTEMLRVEVSHFQAMVPGFTHHPLDLEPGRLLQPTATLEFVDRTGCCWRRDPGGNLVAISELRLGGQVVARTPTGGRPRT